MPRTILAFDEIRIDEYAVAEEAVDLGAQIIADYPEVHGHLDGVQIGYLFRDDEVRDHETKVVVASAHLVTQLISGGGAKYFSRLVKWALLKEFGFLPTFLILIDKNIWDGCSPEEKRFYLDHEIEHCIQKADEDGVPRFNQQTGEPVWGIKPHDAEEFFGAMRRNGITTETHREMCRTAVDLLNEEARGDRVA